MISVLDLTQGAKRLNTSTNRLDILACPVLFSREMRETLRNNFKKKLDSSFFLLKLKITDRRQQLKIGLIIFFIFIGLNK